MTTASDDHGLVGPDGVAQRQSLVLIPGQFVERPGTGRHGTQLLFDRMAGDVYYSASDDWTSPTVGTVDIARNVGEKSSGVVSVDAHDASGVHRVIALYNAGGPWQSTDLAFDGGQFTGSISVPTRIPNEQIRVIVQVVDRAGNSRGRPTRVPASRRRRPRRRRRR